jgi:hypothetical protein
MKRSACTRAYAALAERDTDSKMPIAARSMMSELPP